MSWFKLVLAYLRAKPLVTSLHLLMVALGIATLTALILVNAQVAQRLDRDLAGIDMVVGAKGSPMQLILSSVFQVDSPTGNIPEPTLDWLEDHKLVKEAIPLALGDNVQGFRIIGTTSAYANHYGATLAEGALFSKTLEATLGATVAAKTGLNIGDKFTGSHGLGEGGEVHDQEYTVVGIFAPTRSVVDRLVLTPVSSVWAVHGGHHDDDVHATDKHAHHDHDAHESHDEHEAHDGVEITAALVKFSSPMAFGRLPREINSSTNLQAAVPAYEAARLFSVFGVGVNALQAVAVLLLVTASLSLFVALNQALHDRKYDLALLRTLGVKPAALWRLLVAEALVIGLVGALLGVVLGHGLIALLPLWLTQAESLAITPWWFEPLELGLVVGMGVLSVLASLVPAWRAYRMNLSEVLKAR